MPRMDSRKTINVYAPNSNKAEKATLLNARDLLNHCGYTTHPQGGSVFNSVADEIAAAPKENTPEEDDRLALLAKPVDLMNRDELRAYLKEVFGVDADRRAGRDKLFQQVEMLATNSNVKLILSGAAPAPVVEDDETADEPTEGDDGDAEDDNEA